MARWMMAGFPVKGAVLCAFAACVLAGGAAAAPESAPQSIVVTGQRAASAWVRAESAHVAVLSDAPREEVARLVEHLERLEALLRVYTAGYRVTASGPERRTNVVYLDSFNALRRVRPELSPFLVSLTTDCQGATQSFFLHTQPLPALEDDKLAVAKLHKGLAWLSKAYARDFLLRHTDVRAPRGWVEGFSTYFSSAMFGTRQMVIGRMPADVAEFFQISDGGADYRLEYGDVLASDPFKNVLYWENQRLAASEFQAKAWVLAHYILGEAGRRERLGAFLNAVHRGADGAAALRDAFGLDVDNAGTALWRYRLRDARVLRVEMPAPMQVRPEIAWTTISEAAGKFVLADAVLKGCPARARGESLLRTLDEDAAGVPNVDAAQLALSRARVGYGDPAAALPWLRRTARQPDAGADVLVLLARADLKLAARADAEARAAYLDDARAGLARARAREPASGAVALAGLELSLLADRAPSREALDGIFAAWDAAHDSSSLARAAALAWCYLGDAAKAGHVLRMMANDGFDPRFAAWAVVFQRRLDAGLTPAAIADEMLRNPDDDADG
ncbi:hypothetical protein IA69_30700 [Massilia sp. JS1662]|nr:hypothetical protein IA69_30700 [Massilia sp. JS1662]